MIQSCREGYSVCDEAIENTEKIKLTLVNTPAKTHNLSTSCARNKLVNKVVAMLLFCQVVPSL